MLEPDPVFELPDLCRDLSSGVSVIFDVAGTRSRVAGSVGTASWEVWGVGACTVTAGVDVGGSGGGPIISSGPDDLGGVVRGEGIGEDAGGGERVEGGTSTGSCS